MSEDEQDWQSACRGDGEAFGRLFDRHRDRVTRHAWRLVETHHDAEDVVAVAFLETWRRRENVRIVDGSLLPWLLVTATNCARNVGRAARRHRTLLARLPEPATQPDIADAVDDGPGLDSLRTLSISDQRILTLRVLLGLNDTATAEMLGIPVGTAKSRLSRATSRLRSAYEQTESAYAAEGAQS